MKHIVLFVFCVTQSLKICAQPPVDSIDVWKVKITFLVTSKDDIRLNKGKTFRQFTYFINHNLILRKDELDNKSSLTENTSGAIKDKSVVEFINPVYLINLDSSLVFTYCKDDTGVFVVSDSLKNHFEEIFYKFFDRKHIFLNPFVSKINDKNSTDSFYGSHQAIYSSGTYENGDTSSFWLSKDTLPFNSPLDYFYSNSIKNVLAACFRSPENFNEMGCFLIDQFEKIRVSKSYFLLPPIKISSSSISNSKIVTLLYNPFN